jgi:stage V sporulation protein AC
MMSASLEYRKEGLVTGIGTNMFKLAGSVIIFGTVSAYLVGLIRLILFGG